MPGIAGAPAGSWPRAGAPAKTLCLDFLGIFGRRDTATARAHQQLGTQGGIELLGRGRVVLEPLAGVLFALPDPFAAVAVPGAGFLDEIVGDTQFDQLALVGGAFAVQDFELCLAE